MDQLEFTMIRMKRLQDELMPYPEWAKAENAECCFSLQEIWHIGRKPSDSGDFMKIVKKAKEVCFVVCRIISKLIW